MKNAMFLGLAIGMVAGACLVNNSKKARQVVSDAQKQIKNKLCPQQDECHCDRAFGENNG